MQCARLRRCVVSSSAWDQTSQMVMLSSLPLPPSHVIIMKNFRDREKLQKYYSALLLPYLLESVTVNLLYLLHRSA